VRRAVSGLLADWGYDLLAQDAALAASELASNAILHTMSPYELVVRPVSGGVRLEVVDRRPDLCPGVVPTTGTAKSITATGTTGRGLQIVAQLASRWGYTTSVDSKSVWVEITEPGSTGATDPIVAEGHRRTEDPDAVAFRLLSMPVRAAVASGVHVEELVRDLQIARGTAAIDASRAAELRELLDVSAPARLLGRHAAFRAAAQNEQRFDLEVRLSPANIAGFAALNTLLTETSAPGPGAARVSAEVAAFRTWIVQEITRQAAGRAPMPCPLPDAG
jgi:anti-sigma regulatory factor (Ser/Thr protein kinase)